MIINRMRTDKNWISYNSKKLNSSSSTSTSLMSASSLFLSDDGTANIPIPDLPPEAILYQYLLATPSQPLSCVHSRLDLYLPVLCECLFHTVLVKGFQNQTSRYVQVSG
jgi:hypothetical protein